MAIVYKSLVFSSVVLCPVHWRSCSFHLVCTFDQSYILKSYGLPHKGHLNFLCIVLLHFLAATAYSAFLSVLKSFQHSEACLMTFFWLICFPAAFFCMWALTSMLKYTNPLMFLFGRNFSHFGWRFFIVVLVGFGFGFLGSSHLPFLSFAIVFWAYRCSLQTEKQDACASSSRNYASLYFDFMFHPCLSVDITVSRLLSHESPRILSYRYVLPIPCKTGNKAEQMGNDKSFQILISVIFLLSFSVEWFTRKRMHELRVIRWSRGIWNHFTI